MDEPALIASWESLDDLHEHASATARPWVLIEAAGEGIAVSPVFGGSGGTCFSCFLRRRASNSTGDLRPAPPGRIAAFEPDILAALADLGAAPQHATVIGGDRTRRLARLLPFPHCPRCAALGTWSPEPATPREWVDADLGLVSRIEAWPSDVPGIVARHAVGARTDAAGLARAYNHGAAADSDADLAALRATAEAIERYAAAIFRPPLRLATAGHLDGPALRPPRVVADDPMGAPLRWLEGRRLCGEGTVWLPAASVILPYAYGDDETPLPVQTSCGLAAAPDLDRAIGHAVAELVERDAAMRAWRLGLAVERIPSVPFDIPGLHVVRLPSPYRLHVSAALIERDEPPFTAVGLGAGLSLAAAVRSAVLEAVLVRTWLRHWLAHGGSRPPDRPTTLPDHARLHAVEPSLAAARRRWTHTPLICERPPPSVDRTAVLEALPAAGWVDLTTPDIAAAGWSAVRAVAPGLLPLDTDARSPLLDADRTPHPIG